MKSSLANLPDSQLVPLAVAGNRDALEELTLRHNAFVHNVAWKMTFDPNDATDLTQEFFVKATTWLSQFEGRIVAGILEHSEVRRSFRI
jgi:DNA-directed RNA polymerase specialized sigma24 family protein